jgi:peptidoglycan/xylan/chitin deacetylase (PgdA/CDA1 family)
MGQVVFALRPSPKPEPAIRILMYHDIVEAPAMDDRAQMTTPLALFTAHMRWLKEDGYQVISSAEALELLTERQPWPERRLVVLTFDDGFRTYLTNAWPVLESLGFPSTVFIPTDVIGQGPAYLSWPEVKELASSSLVTVGAHSVSHTKLLGLPLEAVRHELRDSKRILEEQGGRPVNLFAYPYGSYDAFDASTMSALASEGFAGALTTIAGINRPGVDVFRLRRTRISWVDRLPEFQMTMAGAVDWYARYQWFRWHG